MMNSGTSRTLVGAHHPPGPGNLDAPPPPPPPPPPSAAVAVVAPTSEWKQFQAQHGGIIGGIQYHADGSHSSTAASENSEKRKRKQLDHHEGGDEDITKPYECRFCPMKFAKSQALGGHMNRHRQEREREQYMHARQLVMQQQPAAFTSWMLPAQNNSAAAAAHTPASFNRFAQFAQQRDQASQAGLNLRYSSVGVSTPSVPAAAPPANFFVHSSGSAGSNFQQSWQGLLAQPIAGGASGNLLPDNTRSSLQGNTVSFPRDDQMMQPVPNFSQARPPLGISYGSFNTLPSRAISGNNYGNVGQDHLAQGSSPYAGFEQRSSLDGRSFMQSNLSVESGQHIGGLSKHGASSGQATAAASDSKRHSGHSLNLPNIVGAASGTQLHGQFGSFQADQLQSLSQVGPGSTLQSEQITNSQFNIGPGAAAGYGQTSFFPGTSSFGSMQPGSSQSDFLNQQSSVFEGLQGPITYNMLQFSGSKSLNMNPMGSSGQGGVEGTGSFNLALQGAGQVVQEHMLGNNIHDESGSLHSPQSRTHPAAASGTSHHAAASPDHHQLAAAAAQHPSNSPINAAVHERQSSQLQLEASIDQPTLQETLYRYQSDPDMISTSACSHHANCTCRSQYKQHEAHDIKAEFQPPAAPGSHRDPSSASPSPPPPPPTSNSQENALCR